MSAIVFGAALERRVRAMAAASETLLGPPRVNVVELNAILAEESLPPDPADKAGK